MHQWLPESEQHSQYTTCERHDQGQPQSHHCHVDKIGQIQLFHPSVTLEGDPVGVKQSGPNRHHSVEGAPSANIPIRLCAVSI